MNRIKLGLDYYELNDSNYNLINNALKNHWQIYDIHNQRHLFFYASIHDRNSIIAVYPAIKLHKTVGLFGMLFRFLKQKERIVALILCFMLWTTLSSSIFQIEIYVNDQTIHAEIQNTLHLLDYKIPFLMTDKNQITLQLFDELKNQVSWLEIRQKGSKLMIHALARKQAVLEPSSAYNLYAKKDGIVVAFDLKSGNKNVVLNQLVHKGDLLISNQMITSNQEIKEIFVDGKVYAYTVERRQLILDDEGHDALTYFNGVLKMREDVSKHFTQEEYILKEIPLQFTKKEDKIILENVYICYEQIAMLGE